MSLPALRAIFRELQPTGYLGSVLPPEAGGKGLSPLAFAALVEGLAPDLTLLGNHSVQRYLHSFGSATQCRRFMPGLLSGEEVGAIAITEAQAGSDLARIETVARRVGDRCVLNGRKTWVTHGMVASSFIVLARTGEAKDQFARFSVPDDSRGLQRYQQKPVGLTHLSFAHLEFHDCEIDVELRLGEEGQGLKGAKEAFPIARVLAALQALRVGRAHRRRVGHRRGRRCADLPLQVVGVAHPRPVRCARSARELHVAFSCVTPARLAFGRKDIWRGG